MGKGGSRSCVERAHSPGDMTEDELVSLSLDIWTAVVNRSSAEPTAVMNSSESCSVVFPSLTQALPVVPCDGV